MTAPKTRARKEKGPKAGPTPSRRDAELAGSEKVATTLTALAEAVEEATAGEGPLNIDASPALPEELEHIFTLEGRSYSVAKNPPRSLMVDYLRKVQVGKTEGELAVATYDLLTTMLGTEAMAALRNSPKVTDRHMDAVFSAVTKVAFRALAKLTEEFSGAVTPGN